MFGDNVRIKKNIRDGVAVPYKLFVNTVNIACTAYIAYTHSGMYADL